MTNNLGLRFVREMGDFRANWNGPVVRSSPASKSYIDLALLSVDDDEFGGELDSITPPKRRPLQRPEQNRGRKRFPELSPPRAVATQTPDTSACQSPVAITRSIAPLIPMNHLGDRLALDLNEIALWPSNRDHHAEFYLLGNL
jgi:hypothetical protein